MQTATAAAPSPEIAAILAEAQATDAETAPGAPIDPNAPPPPPAPDYLGDAAGLVDIVAESVGAFWPSTAAVLDEKARGRIAKPLSRVMEKHGWDMAALFGKWGEEIQLGFVLAQLAVPLAKAIRADRAAARIEAPKAPPPPATPGPAETPAPPASDLYARA